MNLVCREIHSLCFFQFQICHIERTKPSPRVPASMSSQNGIDQKHQDWTSKRFFYKKRKMCFYIISKNNLTGVQSRHRVYQFREICLALWTCKFWHPRIENVKILTPDIHHNTIWHFSGPPTPCDILIYFYFRNKSNNCFKTYYWMFPKYCPRSKF